MLALAMRGSVRSLSQLPTILTLKRWFFAAAEDDACSCARICPATKFRKNQCRLDGASQCGGSSWGQVRRSLALQASWRRTAGIYLSARLAGGQRFSLDSMTNRDLTAIVIDDYQEISVPNGKLAEVVTYLEMRAPAVAPIMADGPWTLDHCPNPDIDWYLSIYRAIGEKWLWYSRLVMPKEKVAAILKNSHVHVFALRRDGLDVGLAELSFSTPDEVEICFLGVASNEIGGGAGRWLLAEVLRLAWAEAPKRVWLHTCTLDHPNALPFYLRHGFRAYKRTLGVCTDPRLAGILVKAAELRIPVIPPDSGDRLDK